MPTTDPQAKPPTTPTTPDPDAMEAGRELDAMVMEAIGYKPVPVAFMFGHKEPFPGWDEPPRYSTDIAAAWQVVDAMRERGWRFSLHEHPDGWWAAFNGKMMDAPSATVPLAICRTALWMLQPQEGSWRDAAGCAPRPAGREHLDSVEAIRRNRGHAPSAALKAVAADAAGEDDDAD